MLSKPKCSGSVFVGGNAFVIELKRIGHLIWMRVVYQNYDLCPRGIGKLTSDYSLLSRGFPEARSRSGWTPQLFLRGSRRASDTTWCLVDIGFTGSYTLRSISRRIQKIHTQFCTERDVPRGNVKSILKSMSQIGWKIGNGDAPGPGLYRIRGGKWGLRNITPGQIIEVTHEKRSDESAYPLRTGSCLPRDMFSWIETGRFLGNNIDHPFDLMEYLGPTGNSEEKRSHAVSIIDFVRTQPLIGQQKKPATKPISSLAAGAMLRFDPSGPLFRVVKAHDENQFNVGVQQYGAEVKYRWFDPATMVFPYKGDKA